MITITAKVYVQAGKILCEVAGVGAAPMVQGEIDLANEIKAAISTILQRKCKETSGTIHSIERDGPKGGPR